MKLLGGLLLTAAGLLSGLLAAGSLSQRLSQCRALCQMLRLMAFSLERFLTPLPELFSDLSGRLPGRAGQLCREVSQGLENTGQGFFLIWQEAVAPLPTREQEILLPLGHVLGQYGAEEQIGAVSAGLREMTALCDELDAGAREKSRVYIGLCTAGGLMLAVLLI